MALKNSASLLTKCSAHNLDLAEAARIRQAEESGILRDNLNTEGHRMRRNGLRNQGRLRKAQERRSNEIRLDEINDEIQREQDLRKAAQARVNALREEKRELNAGGKSVQRRGRLGGAKLAQNEPGTSARGVLEPNNRATDTIEGENSVNVETNGSNIISSYDFNMVEPTGSMDITFTDISQLAGPSYPGLSTPQIVNRDTYGGPSATSTYGGYQRPREIIPIDVQKGDTCST